jgi:argininosuccinate synthase
MATLILYYDAAHTPLARLVAALPANEDPVVLSISIGGDAPLATPALTTVRIVQVNAMDRFADEYLARAIKSNARYDGGYFLSAALSRPMIAEITAQEADSLGADTVVHGFTGNDALRLTTGLRVIAPHLRIRTVRELCGDAIDDGLKGYTVSSNLWGRSVEGASLSNPSQPAPSDIWGTVYPDRPERVQIDFERGVPVAIGGERMCLANIVAVLTSIGQPFGSGRFDIVEHGHVGLKTRAVYHAPAAAALIAAHEDLERLVCSRREHRFKRLADMEWSEVVYDGLWFDPVRSSLDRLIDGINERVTGRVTLEYNPGAVSVVARESEFAIYDDTRAVYRAGELFGRDLIPELAEQQSLAGRLVRASRQKGARCSV